MPIRILDAETVSRIAAGEVVERPASIVKEMIENAIDAGSTSVTVEIREGGLEYMRITDNGCGIPAEETRFAFTNHATSKLSSGDSLTDIRTLGFRGEALASIAAVSKVEMRTRTRGAESGAIVRVEGGQWMGMQDVGCPEGTSITVRDLFYNVPARRAFLKKAAYEAGVIHDTVTKMILGNPGVAIRLINNGKTVAHSYGDGKLRSAALAALGRETASAMEEIDVSEGSFRLTGLIGLGDLARQNRSMQYFFVNGRSIRCLLLTAALEQAAKERVGIGMHPICALHVQIPAASVDVNVHPNKLEVRFRDEQWFRTTAEALIRQALQKDVMLDIPALIEEKKAGEEAQSVSEPEKTVLEMTTSEKLARARELAEQQTERKQEGDQFYADLRNTGSSKHSSSSVREGSALSLMGDLFRSANPAPLMPSASETPLFTDGKKQTLVYFDADRPVQKPTMVFDKPTSVYSAPAVVPIKPEQIEQMDLRELSGSVERQRPEYRIIGVTMRTYLILEANDALILIDQHAAHERILFEQYKAQLDLGTASQRLLSPIIMHATPKEIALIEENEDAIRDAGYEVSAFGEREVRIDAVPYILGKADCRLMLGEMIETLSELRGAQLERRLQAVIKLSCRKAIKGGDSLTGAEIDALVSEMLASDAPPTCPHGRPVARVITKNELEKMFWRT
ncbi:MAG: DNA mismatch repair endonuclease MutL [Eubacteriales bacterium]|nr:DNA mismatch repair endonuclease MutL [Eubacteriales bacterium]